MTQTIMSRAVDLLAEHYGRTVESLPSDHWHALVRVVLDGRPSKKAARDWLWIDESPVRSPGEIARQNAAQLAEALVAAGQSASRAGVLNGLAEWWLRRIGDEDASAVFRARSREYWQDELRVIRGVSWELADRILLVVGGLAIYPLDRGSVRIAARHGWMDVTAEYEDWQSFFSAGLCEADVELGLAAQWMSRAGREFCGAKPKCDACPLKSLLPERGAILLDGDDS